MLNHKLINGKGYNIKMQNEKKCKAERTNGEG